ncbi:MAG: DUF1292 domain-containing protein [Eubacteriales bacterium]|nr:DUF1292 domain-containing protein [Eubacteriales bacterium]
MQDDFGPDFISLTDEDGNEFELEVIDALEYNGQTYVACFPTLEEDSEEADTEEYGLVILKSVEENGETYLATPDSEEELNAVYEQFMEQLMEDEGENS